MKEQPTRKWPSFYYATEEEVADKRFRHYSPRSSLRRGVLAYRTWKGPHDRGSLSGNAYKKLYTE